jgi:hypothetical protein
MADIKTLGLQRDAAYQDVEIIEPEELELLNAQDTWILGLLHKRSSACPYVAENSVHVAVTLYSNLQPSEQHIPYHCTKQADLYVKPTGRDRGPRFYSSQYEPLTTKSCAYMVKNSYSPNLEYMIRINDTWRGTQLSIKVNETSITEAAAWNQTVTNHFYQIFNVSLDPLTGFMTSDTVRLDPRCTFQQTQCASDHGTVIWNVPYSTTKPEFCPLHQRKSTNCRLSPTTLICPELGISIVDHTRDGTERCGQKIGYTRVLLERKADLDTRDINQYDKMVKFQLQNEFGYLHKQVMRALNVPSFIKVVHIGSCGFFPQNLTLH